ncbi:MAG: pantetheine-phosphate adenylyltransferase [Desulfotomaculaceae bacterium]|nr:pantetheine-phosphate adenylyltransferase [Desulfotomaculaceae bacterium]
MRTAICPGSFDPVTLGHLDIIVRASVIFDRVIVAVSRNPIKNPMFTIPERVEMLKEVLKPYRNVAIDSFDGLTVYYAAEQSAVAIVRGLRVISDFENEFRMALINKNLACNVETLFLMTRAEYSYISSSAVKDVALFGGPLDRLVPPLVVKKLKEKLNVNQFTGCCDGREV